MEEKKEITVRIMVNDRVMLYRSDYHTLHNNEWNDIIRLALDDEYFDPGKTKFTNNL